MKLPYLPGIVTNVKLASGNSTFSDWGFYVYKLLLLLGLFVLLWRSYQIIYYFPVLDLFAFCGFVEFRVWCYYNLRPPVWCYSAPRMHAGRVSARAYNRGVYRPLRSRGGIRLIRPYYTLPLSAWSDTPLFYAAVIGLV